MLGRSLISSDIYDGIKSFAATFRGLLNKDKHIIGCGILYGIFPILFNSMYFVFRDHQTFSIFE